MSTGETTGRDSDWPSLKPEAASLAAPHVLAIPHSMVTHRVPLLRLAARLSAEAEDITVSFVTYAEDVPSLSAEVSAALPRKREQESVEEQLFRQGFRLIAVPRPSNKPPFGVDDYQRELEPYVAKLVRDKENGVAGGPTCVFSDMFVPWTQDVAEKLKIPRYVLVPAGLVLAKFMLEYLRMEETDMMSALDENGQLKPFEGLLELPELPPLGYKDIPRLARTHSRDAFACCKSFWASDGMAINTFEELDEELIRTWSETGASLPGHRKVPKLYLLGPFFQTTAAKSTPPTVKPGSPFQALLGWLDSQAAASVLYVAFGTQERLSSEQMHELALGLVASEQRFLWVVPDSESGAGLPEGFQDRVRDRSSYILVGFGPQLQILGHPSVGAFLTHAGWNSTLEAIVYGVPLITWPLGAEQQLNSRYLADKLEIAFELPTDPSNVAGRMQVEDAVRNVIVGVEGKRLRGRVEDFQKKARTAVSEGGSQSKNYQNFLNDLRLKL